MAHVEVCDLCSKQVLRGFKDEAYRVTVKRMNNRYDGYAPWVGKTRVTICENCMHKIIFGIERQVPVIDLRLDNPETKEEL